MVREPRGCCNKITLLRPATLTRRGGLVRTLISDYVPAEVDLTWSEESRSTDSSALVM
jgi:hypothetical protein